MQILSDLLLIVYILLLFPLLHECERIPRKGLRILLVGILFTPFTGFLLLWKHHRKKNHQKKGNPSKKSTTTREYSYRNTKKIVR